MTNGGASAEYGSATGSVINVITKSGSNKMHGSASLYYSPDAFTADPPKGKAPGDYYYSSYFEPSINIGGPIIKDKLWFFGGYSMPSRTLPLKNQKDLSINENTYNPYVNFNFQPNLNNRFNFSYNYSNYNSNFEKIFDHSTSGSDYDVSGHMAGAGWRHTLPNKWETRFQTSFSWFGHTYKNTYLTEMTEYNSSSLYDNTQEESANMFRAGLDLWTTPFDCWLGNHLLNMGFQYEATCWRTLDENSSTYTSTHTYPSYEYRIEELSLGRSEERAKMNNFSFFLQDAWTLSDKFTLNLGMRFDKESLTWPGRSRDEYKIETEQAYSWNLFSPRLNLTYDLKGDNRNVVKFSAGRYYYPNQYGWVYGANPWDHYSLNTLKETKNGTIEVDEKQESYFPSSAKVGYNGTELKAPYMDELTLGYERKLWENWSVGLRYIKKWDRNFIQTIDASRFNMDDLTKKDKLTWIGYDPITVTNPLDGKPVSIYEDINPLLANDYRIVNPPGAFRDYDGIELKLNKRFSQGWALNASYVYSNSRGLISPFDYYEFYGQSYLYNHPNAHINAEGQFEYTYPHQFKVHGIWEAPYGIQVGGRLIVLAGARYTPELSSNYPPLNTIPDGFATVYTEERGSSGLPTFWMLNLSLEKSFKITETVTATMFVDGYNITNNTPALQVNPIMNSTYTPYKEIQRILDPSIFRLGAKVEF